MKHRFLMPPIPEAERTPLVIALLGVIEGLAAQVQKQEEEIALLKDEIRILKGGKKRPRFKPSKMDERTEENRRGEGGAQEDQRRAGAAKRGTRTRFASSRAARSARASSPAKGMSGPKRIGAGKGARKRISAVRVRISAARRRSW